MATRRAKSGNLGLKATNAAIAPASRQIKSRSKTTGLSGPVRFGKAETRKAKKLAAAASGSSSK